jgi:hypothetical protein
MQISEYGTVQFVVKWMIETKSGNDLEVSDVYLIEKIVDACHGDLRKHCMSKGVANNVIKQSLEAEKLQLAKSLYLAASDFTSSNGSIPDWWKDCKEIARKMLELESAAKEKKIK